jgi:hypothetical protein
MLSFPRLTAAGLPERIVRTDPSRGHHGAMSVGLMMFRPTQIAAIHCGTSLRWTVLPAYGAGPKAPAAAKAWGSLCKLAPEPGRGEVRFLFCREIGVDFSVSR